MERIPYFQSGREGAGEEGREGRREIKEERRRRREAGEEERGRREG